MTNPASVDVFRRLIHTDLSAGARRLTVYHRSADLNCFASPLYTMGLPNCMYFERPSSRQEDSREVICPFVRTLIRLPVVVTNSCSQYLTPSLPAVPNCCCSKGSVPYWSSPLFLISDIRAVWCLGLSTRLPECPKLKVVG